MRTTICLLLFLAGAAPELGAGAPPFPIVDTRTRRDKLTFAQATARPDQLNAMKFGGFADWRLPSIKELYSLFDGRGTDPSGPMDVDTSRLTPFIGTRYFQFVYGDVTGERVIDSQYAPGTGRPGRRRLPLCACARHRRPAERPQNG